MPHLTQWDPIAVQQLQRQYSSQAGHAHLGVPVAVSALSSLCNRMQQTRTFKNNKQKSFSQTSTFFDVIKSHKTCVPQQVNAHINFPTLHRLLEISLIDNTVVAHHQSKVTRTKQSPLSFVIEQTENFFKKFQISLQGTSAMH